MICIGCGATVLFRADGALQLRRRIEEMVGRPRAKLEEVISESIGEW
jgi:hypothetical protein